MWSERISVDIQIRLSACIDYAAEWVHLNRLQLNAAKTEVLWSTTSRRLHQLPLSWLHAGADLFALSTIVRNLGIFIVADVMRALSLCFAILRQVSSLIMSTTLYPTISAANLSLVANVVAHF